MVIPKGRVTLCLSCLSSSILWNEKLYNFGTYTLSYQYELKETQSWVASLSNTELHSKEHRESQQIVLNLVTLTSLKAYFKLQLPFCKLFIFLVFFNKQTRWKNKNLKTCNTWVIAILCGAEMAGGSKHRKHVN